MSDHEKLQAQLAGLSFGCPFCEVTLECPLNYIRQKDSPADRLDAIKELSENEVRALLSYHQHCLTEREKGLRDHCYFDAERETEQNYQI